MPSLLLLAILPLACANAQDTGFYSLKMKSIKGNEVDFSQFKGKKVLIVNTASECGFTHQYEGLEELYRTYGKKGRSEEHTTELQSLMRISYAVCCLKKNQT